MEKEKHTQEHLMGDLDLTVKQNETLGNQSSKLVTELYELRCEKVKIEERNQQLVSELKNLEKEKSCLEEKVKQVIIATREFIKSE
jgi:predicted nuclease with TOPRIM domain